MRYELSTFTASDRDGRTVATVRAAGRDEALTALRAVIAEGDAPGGWYVGERAYSWHREHRAFQAAATGQYFLPEDCGSAVTTCRGCLAGR